MNASKRFPAKQSTMRALTLALSFLSATLLCFGMQGKQPDQLAQVLEQMETVGKSFRSYTARISLKKFTAVLKEFDAPDMGEFCYSRAKNGSALLRLEITSPGKRILTIRDDLFAVYQPEIKQAQVGNLGRNKDKAEYLALGIGQSPSKLQETFTISYHGFETINGSPCSVLIFKPKDPKAAAIYTSITAWIKKSTGVSTQLKLQEPSNNYLLVSFSDEKLNVKIPDSKFEQKLPKGTEIQRIQ